MNTNGLVERLELIQEAHGWSNREIAERLGISRVFWLKVKQGERIPGRKFLRGVLSAFPELADMALAFLENSE